MKIFNTGENTMEGKDIMIKSEDKCEHRKHFMLCIIIVLVFILGMVFGKCCCKPIMHHHFHNYAYSHQQPSKHNMKQPKTKRNYNNQASGFVEVEEISD